MQNRDTFSRFHPAINFLYFVLVLLFSMFLMHPGCLAVSLISSFSYLIYLRGKKGVRFVFSFALPMMLMELLQPLCWFRFCSGFRVIMK